MLLSIVLLGGIILSATAIGGILIIFQIRGANDAVHSAQAIFAADAGIEWGTYDCLSSTSGTLEALDFSPLQNVRVDTQCDNTSVVGETTIRAQGRSGGAIRALETTYGIGL